jgi:uncharacterized protein
MQFNAPIAATVCRGAGLWFALIGFVMASACAAHAQPKRHAVVVGIDRYEHLPADRQLLRAVADARAMGAAFKDLGFDVLDSGENLDRLEFNRHIQRWLNKIQPGDQVALFFAGHAIEVAGRNLLLTRDVPKLAIGEDELLKSEGIALAGLLEAIRARRPSVAMVIVDACRDNPLPRTGQRSIGGSAGLAREAPPEGTFVIFSAGAGESALDQLPHGDHDRNSVFTRSLVPLMKQPGLTLPELAQEVRRKVRALAASVGHRQTPAYYDEVVGRFCFAGCAPTAMASATEAIMAPLPERSEPTPPPPPRVAAIDDCDRYAAHPHDRTHAATGIELEAIDPSVAIPACERAVQSNPEEVRFAVQLGRAYLRAKRHGDAVRMYRGAADRGNVDALGKLASLYAKGNGVPRSDREAARLFKLAAEKGDNGAMHNYGAMLADGRGDLPRDVKAAARWMVAALKAGGDRSLEEFKARPSSYRPELRRAILQRLKDEKHFTGPVGDTFSPDVLTAMERLVSAGR